MMCGAAAPEEEPVCALCSSSQAGEGIVWIGEAKPAILQFHNTTVDLVVGTP